MYKSLDLRLASQLEKSKASEEKGLVQPVASKRGELRHLHLLRTRRIYKCAILQLSILVDWFTGLGSEEFLLDVGFSISKYISYLGVCVWGFSEFFLYPCNYVIGQLIRWA